jgi:Ca2+-binding EF-hand superfamily protein
MKIRRIFESASVAMFKSASVAMATAVAAAMSVPLYAAPDTPAADRPNPAFQKLDTDRDGYISRDEAAKLRSFEKSVRRSR